MPLIDDTFREDLEFNLQMAEARLDSVRIDIEGWEDEYLIPLDIRQEGDSVVYLAGETPKPPRYLSGLLSEALHHLTLGFEHLAWRLVGEEARSNPKIAYKIAMPTVITSDEWGGALHNKLPGMKEIYQSAVRSIQPFERAKIAGAPPEQLDTVVLRDLDSAAKHRGHHLLDAYMSKGIYLDIVNPLTVPRRGLPFSQRGLGQVIAGDELMRAPGLRLDDDIYIAPPCFRILVRSSGNMRAYSGPALFGMPFEQITRLVPDLRHTLETLIEGIDRADRNAA